MTLETKWGERQRLRGLLLKSLRRSEKDSEIRSDDALKIIRVYDFASQVVGFAMSVISE